MSTNPVYEITEGIRIGVKSEFRREHSMSDLRKFVFAYRIEIANESSEAVQLLRRRWLIVDAFGQRQIVEGEGVVGQQPIIQPGEAYSYASWSMFQTPLGNMSGYYTMIRHDPPEEFLVRIPSFTLEAPFLAN